MKRLLPYLLLCCCLAACAKNPMLAPQEALKKGDREGAVKLLKIVEQEKPELKDAHYLLFALYRLLEVQGEPKLKDQYLQWAIAQYHWIAEHEGFASDYRDMEGTLKANAKAKPAYESAYALVYR